MKQMQSYNLLAILLALVLGLSATLALSTRAQQPTSSPRLAAQTDRAELYQALLDLTNPWTVMCVAAHPDDEDGTTLTMLRRKYGVHTVSLFATYGEGGQNAIGPELYEELGAIRARETMEAAEIQGSTPYFLGLKDFGFSKSAAEAFGIWRHEEALRRMVQRIRELRPDVIITNHNTESGHGHHQATGRLVLEAFDAAADPNRFPEQLENVSVWRPQRLFVRFSFEGGAESKRLEKEAEDAKKIVTINPNERDSVRGTEYAEQALQALQHHATQGPWPRTITGWLRARNIAAGGLPVIRYRLAREAATATPLPENAPTFLAGLYLPEAVQKRLDAPTIEGHPLTDFVDQREHVLEELIAASKSKLFNEPIVSESDPRARSTDDLRRGIMLARLNHALAVAAGFSAKLVPADEVLVPGMATMFSFVISNGGRLAAQAKLIVFGAGDRDSHVGMLANLDAPSEVALAPGQSATIPLKYSEPVNARATVPHATQLYDRGPFGQPFAAGTFIEIEGLMFPLFASAVVDIAPAVEIESITPSPFVLTPATIRKPTTFIIHLVNHERAQFNGSLKAAGYIPHSGQVVGIANFELAANEARDIRLSTIRPAAKKAAARQAPGELSFSVLHTNSRPPSNQIAQQKLKSIWSDARVTPNLRVGYVRSFDSSLPVALAALGVNARELAVANIGAEDLASIDTIIVDNRGYEAHAELIAANRRLLDYVSAGGTLVVFYHKANEWNPDPKRNRPQLAPYPIILGDERVTDENAAVSFIQPANPLLKFPNRITKKDFEGWIQERGLYYPKEWDQHYSAPLATSDGNEPLLRGGLLVADYGRGHYVYTSMVWYRQLRAGGPGAYRMLANLISYGHRQGLASSFRFQVSKTSTVQTWKLKPGT